MSGSTKNRKLRPRCPQCGYRVDDIQKHLWRCDDMKSYRNANWKSEPKRISK